MKPTLKDLREQAGKTCAEVAKLLNVSLTAIYNYESGIRRLNIEQVKPLAEFYEVFTSDIVEAAVNSLVIGKSN